MLTHEHAWSFDPKQTIVISTANTVFREIRLKYGYTRDDELGSKPNDWKKDGLNNVNYTIVLREHRPEYLFMRTDVSMIRATNMSVALNGTNHLHFIQDFETNRLSPRKPCSFSDKLEGHLPLQSRIQNATNYDNAKELCALRLDCYAISMLNNNYMLHNETVILHNRQYFVSGAGDTVRTNLKVLIILIDIY